MEKTPDMQNFYLFYFLWQLTYNTTDHFIIKQWDMSNPGVCYKTKLPSETHFKYTNFMKSHLS